MKNGWYFLILLLGLSACTNDGRTISVQTDSVGRELDTLGTKISQKAVAVGDSVSERLNNIKEVVAHKIDSIRVHRDTTK